MKTFINSTILKSFALIALVTACSEPEIVPSRKNDPIIDNGSPGPVGAENGRLPFNQNCNPPGPHYNLNVWLLGANPGQVGFIAFRQRENETQLIHLDTRIMGLDPNTSYLLQRAVDTTLDGNCTSTSWLTLGKGLDPQALTTGKHGFAREQLFRSVSTIPVGSTFDIHFQIIKESTGEVVLASECYEYTVR